MYRNERTRFFLGGCGCSSLVLFLLIVSLLLVVPRLVGTALNNNPLGRISTQAAVFSPGQNRVLAISSLMPVRTTPA